MHSPDRRYWWDGKEWRLAVSPDGRLWFDGTEWRPNPLIPPGFILVPTRLTLPLQAAVVAVTVLAFGLFVATLPLMVASMPTPTAIGVPEGTSREAAAHLTQTFRSMMISSLVFMAVVVAAVATLIVIGTVRRWRWMFWAVVILFGLNAIPVLIPLLLHVAGLLPTMPPPESIATQPPRLSMPISVVGTVALAASGGLFFVMIVAGVRIGPWACRKAAEVAPAEQPARA